MVAFHEIFDVVPHRLLAEGEEGVLGERRGATARSLSEDPGRCEAHVAAQGDEPPGLPQRHLVADVPDHVMHVPAQEPDALLVAAVPRGEALAHPDRAEGVGARPDRLPTPQEGDVGAAATDLGEDGVDGEELLMVA